MDKKLLLKEQEYLEINKKLDMRTRELLEKMDHYQSNNINDLFKPYSQSDPTMATAGEGVGGKTGKLKEELPRSKSATCNPSVAQFTSDELKMLNIPEDINHVGSKGFVHFLKSKVKQLQLEADQVKQEHKTKCEEVKILQKDKVKLQEDKEKFLQQGNVARCQITKLESQLTLVQTKLHAKEGETISLAKELDTLARDLKSVKGSAQNGEVRCQRALEELSKLKLSLRSMQQSEKDLVSSHRKHSNAMSDTIKRLEKQKIELLAGFKKQQALIDNLKQQRVTSDAMKYNAKTEADFIKMMIKEDSCV